MQGNNSNGSVYSDSFFKKKNREIWKFPRQKLTVVMAEVKNILSTTQY